MGNHSFDYFEKNKATLSLIMSLFVFLAALFYMDYKDKKEFREHSKQLNQQVQQEYLVQEQLKAGREEYYNFYQKLRAGIDVNILVVGDSIENGSNIDSTWRTLLDRYLEENYYISVRITNISLESNTSYAGYTRVMALDDEIDYDLAIICYGQYDEEEDFGLYYESMIRAIGQKYDNCCVISVLEHSQLDYTNKIQTIMSIADHYKIPIADTIAAFNSGKYGETGDYFELTEDRIHPNNLGQEVYLDVIRTAIEENATDEFSVSNVEPIYNGVESFETFRYIPVEEFERVNDNTYEIQTNAEGEYVGLDYYYLNGENTARIYADGKLFATLKVSYGYNFSKRHIALAGKNLLAKDSIRVVFETKEEAETFQGLVFSGFLEQ